ncbi:DegQ family serine endoprotease [Denitrobaculum tricleocarpae]|uniref:Probable periplasmic serine endoprotease DegP-like n=1 Tax=Denitrobaculum tricleocarpae TaxID=2591009 RepID=A0A545T0Y6_9PROT|nr:DegQ family serine endoprotease [Denitrobaculum tricleocarpae]
MTVTLGHRSQPRCRAKAVAKAQESRNTGLVVLAVTTIIALTLWSFSAQARNAPESFADLAEKLLPSVVNISASQRGTGSGGRAEDQQEGPAPGQDFEEFFKDFFERRGRPPERRRGGSQGSGFIISEEGFIVTNHHVIEGADDVSVRLHDGVTLKAEVVGSDEKTDLALLKVDPPKDIVAVGWGDSDETRIGDWVVAIGNPFGLGGTVTAGIVSARQRDINAGPYDDFIQTDAAINRGNSGGPMFNLDGDVIGVNTAIFSPSGGSVGIGFAIPSTLARNIVSQLREFKEVKRGWLGVHIQTVTDELAEGLRLKDSKGALVASVTEGGPAEEAGILQGDVILKFDGRVVPDMRKLPRMVAETPIGESVDVVVWRRGEEKVVKVDLGRLQDEPQVAAVPQNPTPDDVTGEVSDLGLALGQITPELRQQFELDDKTNGVVITDVEQDSTAAEKGLRPGDVIVEVDQEEVGNPAEVQQRVEKAKEEGYRVVTLLVYRQGDFQWVAVRLKKDG